MSSFSTRAAALVLDIGLFGQSLALCSGYWQKLHVNTLRFFVPIVNLGINDINTTSAETVVAAPDHLESPYQHAIRSHRSIGATNVGISNSLISIHAEFRHHIVRTDDDEQVPGSSHRYTSLWGSPVNPGPLVLTRSMKTTESSYPVNHPQCVLVPSFETLYRGGSIHSGRDVPGLGTSQSPEYRIKTAINGVKMAIHGVETAINAVKVPVLQERANFIHHNVDVYLIHG
ncbi:hypothetical protein F5884DRAFT_48391 [Xylogone sp. PMI_703]|nr:hypothetical protein F5884DRAFT_48391 [Xylogone sp. PMI_703]